MRLCLSCIVTLCTNNLSCVSARLTVRNMKNKKNMQNNSNIKISHKFSLIFVRFLAYICAHTQPLKNEYLRIVLYCSAILVEPKCDLKWMVIWYWSGRSGIPELQIWMTQNDITLRVTNSKGFIQLFFLSH